MAPPPPGEPAPVAPLGTAQGLGGTPEEIAADLDRISLSLRDFRTVMVENPVGNNAEITRALMGENAKGARLAPPDARVDADGRMIDRWGTPYFFHQISATSMEIHSAGPDRKMGTEDDIVHR
jgi:hypothetical protein